MRQIIEMLGLLLASQTAMAAPWEIPRADHFPQTTNPAAFAKALWHFVSK